MELAVPLLGAVLLIFLFSAGVTSMLEKEKRAACLSFISGILLSFPFLLPMLDKDLTYPDWLSTGLVSLMGCFLVISLIPVRGQYTFQRPRHRIDERDTMFSRQELVPGSRRFEEYYRRRPQLEPLDNAFRSRPGLLKPGSRYYDPLLFTSTRSIFDEVEALHLRLDGEPAQVMAAMVPAVFSDTLLGMARRLGAHSAGITKLSDYHVYSFGGRGDRYGKAFMIRHTYAIAMTVEMDYHMMHMAPAAPTMLESARQYLRSGKIAIEMAEYIRSCGYPARAHIDANYQVVCPLVARDAGLGEIGRLGLLMTPALGPRVRIAVVTTDAPLVPSSAREDAAVIDFCRNCQKCASVCPARSIPFGPEQEIDGIKRWQVNSESCYTYWCQAGTDCGRCVIVCPFAHPDNWFHRLVRIGVRNSLIFRRLSILMDDLFYGRRPSPREPG